MNLKLLVARKQRNLSQQQLGALVELSQVDISRIEKGGWIPPPEIRDRIAAALDTTSLDLFAIASENDPAPVKARSRGAR